MDLGIIEWGKMFLAAVLAVAIRFFRFGMSQRLLFLNVTVGVAIAFYAVPAIISYKGWSVDIGYFITFGLTLVWDRLLKAAETKIDAFGKSDVTISGKLSKDGNEIEINDEFKNQENDDTNNS